MKTLITILLVAMATFAHATTSINNHIGTGVELGHIEFNGIFTSNHYYNFNNPALQPFGTFGTMTVTKATGTFEDVVIGDALWMNTQYLVGLTSDYTKLSSPMIWSVGDFTFDTQYVWFTGPVGSYSLGAVSINGFNPQDPAYDWGPYPMFAYWDFEMERSHYYDTTSPISLQLHFGYYDHTPSVHEGGSTLVMFGLVLTMLVIIPVSRRRLALA